ncbi:MAG: zinc-ribbon domain-containing protein [Thermoplasmatales archaeon]|nr:MAG: zinc-ribbon domain-containing protein [Thermoplasmatales archaeon]
MTYCSKCGTKNEDEAEFCKKCGDSLTGKVKVSKKGDPCEDECVVGQRSPFAPIFWGVIVILVGLWILFEIVIKNTNIYNQLPEWLQNFEFWWLIGLIIAIAIIMTGVRIIVKK